jgi:thiol-disulfide isomerase/thioredoxin
MKTLLPLILMMLTAASAQEPDVTAKAIRAAIDEYENSVRANTMKIIEAKTEEEKNKYRATVPSAEPCAKKVLKIVQEHLSEPGTARGVSWLVTQAAAFPEGQTALQMLGTSHAAMEGVAEAVKSLEYYPFEVASPILKAVREKNPNAAEKAAATYALGMQHLRRFEMAADEQAGAADKEKAMEYLQEISARYATTTINGFPIAEQAGRTMFELANLSVGSDCPEIEGKELNGAAFKLSEHRGKHVVLMFWGGWCHACHDAIPLVNQFATATADKGVVVLGVNTDVPEEARKAYETFKVNFRNWSDGTTSGPITSMFNLRSFPTFYLLDPKGRIVLKNTSLDAIRSRLSL